MYEIGALEFVKNEFLPDAVYFGIESPFSKGKGAAFSEGSSPAPGPI